MTRGDTLVVGIGRPSGGDDAVGLVVAERLRAMGVEARSVTDGAALAAALSTVERAVIIDAVAGGGVPGTVLHLSGDALEARAGAVPVSSHGLSVADAVALARALGGANTVHLVGVAIEPGACAAASLGAEAAAAVEPAAARVCALLQAEWAADTEER